MGRGGGNREDLVGDAKVKVAFWNGQNEVRSEDDKSQPQPWFLNKPEAIRPAFI